MPQQEGAFRPCEAQSDPGLQQGIEVDLPAKQEAATGNADCARSTVRRTPTHVKRPITRQNIAGWSDSINPG